MNGLRNSKNYTKNDMAEINEIIAKEAIEGIKQADKSINAFDDSLLDTIQRLKALDEVLSTNSKSYKLLAQGQKLALIEAQNLQRQMKAKEKADQEVAKATKKVVEAEAKAAKAIADAKEEIKKEIKTRGDALRQNKAYNLLITETINLTTKAGQALKDKYNKQIEKNTEFVRQNSDAMTRQKMNIGNYASALNGVKSVALGVAGALGLSVGLAGAVKLLTGIFESTQGASDAFHATMSGLKEQAGYLQRAFANMDFSNFIQNMQEANREGRRYYNTLDLIGDLQRANQLQQGDIDRQILEQRIIAKNKSLEVSVREAAVKEIIRLEELKLSKTQDITKKGIDNELKSAAFQTKYSEKQILDFVKNYETYTDEITKGQALISKITKETQSVQNTQYGSQTVVDYKAREQAYKNLNIEQQKQLMYAILEKRLTDDKREAIVKAASEDQKAVNEMLTGKESLIRIENGLRKELLREDEQEEKSAAKRQKEVEKQKTGIELLTEKISKLRDELANTVLKGGNTDGIVRQIMGSEAELKRIQEQVEAITGSMQRMASKGFKTVTDPFTGKKSIANIPTSGANTGILQPRTATGGTAAAGAAGTNSLLGEWTTENSIEAAQTTSDTIFTIIANSDQAAFDHKMSLLEKEKQAKLSNSKLTEKQRAKIEADYAKKQAKMKEEQFRKEKAASIIQAIINTALAVSKAAGNISQMILAGLVGAAQVAIIAKQPVPEFDKGSSYTPHTFIAGERRPEWVRSRSGGWRYVDRPTMFKNAVGSTVISGAETERLRRAGLKPSQADIRPAIGTMERNIVNAINSKHELSISSRGDKITDREGSYNKEYFNRRVQWAGRKN